MPSLAHLHKADDLVTSSEATRAGFLALAIERNRLATPLVDRARAFRAAVISAGSIERAANDEALKAALLAAAGVSDKALRYFKREEQEAVIKDLVERYAAPAGQDFVDELVSRFLLTKGDALGGTMRNVGGRLAQRRFVRAVSSALEVAGASYYSTG